eukprot:tig00020911_g15730.t1
MAHPPGHPGIKDPLRSRVELRISCSQLKRMDLTSKSDPMCVVFSKLPGDARWFEVGRTETIWDNQNPKFVKSVEMDFLFEVKQDLRFAVYDVDSKSASLDSQDFQGQLETCLGEIVGARGNTISRPLKNPSRPNTNLGLITVTAEEIKEGGTANDIMRLVLEGRHLAKKDFFGLGKSDPYYVLSREGGGGFVPVLKSEWVSSKTDLVWAPQTLTMGKLCNGELDRPLKIEVFDYDSVGAHDFIGACTTTARQLLEFPREGLPLVDPKKAAKKPDYRESGRVHVNSVSVERSFTFLDFVAGGCEISLLVAIDFTGSNGDPRSPDSLHFCGNPAVPNEYEQAITAVGSILDFYDSDHQYPAYGFGGQLPSGQTSHCFALNGNPAAAEVQGIQGILDAYHQALRSVALSGPTYFAPTIKAAAAIAAQGASQAAQKYSILLILTDGQINDLERTKDELVAASALPLSVVIVGVGSADFSSMDALDSDDKLLRSGNAVAARDIVQFVPFSQFRGRHPADLTRAVLAEIPRQLVDYMKHARRTPLPRQAPPPQPLYPQMAASGPAPPAGPPPAGPYPAMAASGPVPPAPGAAPGPLHSSAPHSMYGPPPPGMH